MGGCVPAAVREILAEARRIRDAWKEAQEEALVALREEQGARLRRKLAALHRWAGLERRRLQREALIWAEEAAELLLRRELRGALILESVELPPTESWLILWLHPKDQESLAQQRLPQGILLRSHPGLEPGDLIIEGPAGRVDARLSTRLRSLHP